MGTRVRRPQHGRRGHRPHRPPRTDHPLPGRKLPQPKRPHVQMDQPKQNTSSGRTARMPILRETRCTSRGKQHDDFAGGNLTKHRHPRRDAHRRRRRVRRRTDRRHPGAFRTHARADGRAPERRTAPPPPDAGRDRTPPPRPEAMAPRPSPGVLDRRAQRTARRIPARPRRGAAAPRGTTSPANAGSSTPASATRDAWPNRSSTTAGPSPPTRRPARSSPARRSTPPANIDTASRRTMSTMPHDRCKACLRRPVNYAPRHHSTNNACKDERGSIINC